LLDLCCGHFDPQAEPVIQHTGYGRTTVLRAATRHGEVIVKRHRDRERHDRECNAYRHWVSVLGDRAPRLLAEIDDPPAIIVTALPGTPLAALALPPAGEQDAFGQAGALLAAWHNAESPAATPDMTAWLAGRGEQWLELAKAILPAAKRADIRAHLRALAGLGPIPAVPCHLDYTPRNLLYDEECTVRVIDFEHARYDLAARDMVRLANRAWRERPDLEDAFLSRYGPLSELDRQVMEHCTHLDTLTAAVRATRRALPPSRSEPWPRGAELDR